MKFSQMPLGRRFLYQGDRYVKVGPLTACWEGTAETRLIPRSAAVSPVEEGGERAPAQSAKAPGWLSTALDGYEQALRAVLLPPGSEPHPDLGARLESALAVARLAFYEEVTARHSSGGE